MNIQNLTIHLHPSYLRKVRLASKFDKNKMKEEKTKDEEIFCKLPIQQIKLKI